MKKDRRRIIIDFEVLSKAGFWMCCMKDYKTNKEHTAPIFNINGDWLYVSLKEENGKKVFGWLEPEMQCGSPFTTCP